jgi:hypothetical protein
VLAAATVLLMLAPRAVFACSVCTSGRAEQNQAAFLAMTIVMSLLPVTAIGTAIWWIRRRLRAMEAANAGLPAQQATRAA